MHGEPPPTAVGFVACHPPLVDDDALVVGNARVVCLRGIFFGLLDDDPVGDVGSSGGGPM